MEKISQNLINELQKPKLGITDGTCRGVQVLAYRLDGKYGEYKNGKKKEPQKLKNISLLDLINIICDTNYYFECRKRALKQYYKDKETDPNAELKAKNGACAVFPFLDYRYKKEEDGNITNLAYFKFQGTQLFDGDFAIKSGKLTLDEAKYLSTTILQKLYPKLIKYNWFVFCCESTSAKGIHIYTHTEKPEFDCEYNDNGSKKWVGEITKDDYAKYSIKWRNISYQTKLYYIYKELKDIWDELNLEEIQPLNSFFDNAMYTHIGQPFNVTPMHKGNILLNPNFKCCIDKELLSMAKNDSINDIRDIFGLDNNIVEISTNNLSINKDNTTSTDYLFETITEIKSTNYDLTKNLSESGFYFGHDTRHMSKVKTDDRFVEVETPLIKEVIHTMKCFYTDNEITKIWQTKGFYNQDANEANVISWIKNWKEYDKDNNLIPREKYVPKRSVVEFLNKWCGFDIQYNDYTINIKSKNVVKIPLTENEYLSDYWEKIIKAIGNENGIYLLESPTGSGKTATHVNINKNLSDDIFNCYMQRPVIMTEPYNSILMSKFNDKSIEVITGSKRFPQILSSKTMYATNYIHFQEIDIEDIKLFKYIIIDESHLLTKEEFRSKQLIEFIYKIKELSKNSIVILQTATPMDERITFEIKCTFKLIKKDKRNINYKYIKFNRKENEKFSLFWTYSIIKDRLNKGIKTYVYYNSVDYRQANILASFFERDYNVAVYHKRIILKNEYENSAMEYITNEHIMGKYDLLISSVYFGVGNDLNDEVENACCIIIGNNVWQEDVQVFGRFRNAKNIEVISVLKEDIDNSGYNYLKLLHYAEKNALYNFYDRTKRKNSNVIWSKLENEEEAKIYSIIKINELYHSSKMIKDEMLPLYVNEYDEEIQEIEPDRSLEDSVKEIYKELKEKALDEKEQILKKLLENKNAEIQYKNEPKHDKWINTIKRLRYNVPDDVFERVWRKLKGYGTIHYIGLFNDILKQYYDNSLDYAEIASFEYYRNSEKTSEDLIHAYLIWYFYCNYDDSNDYMIESQWWFDFKFKCKKYAEIPDELISFLFNDAKVALQNKELKELEELEEFFGHDTLKNEIDKVKDMVIKGYDPNGKITGYKKSKMSLKELTEWIMTKDKHLEEQRKKEEQKENTSKGGKKGGKNGSPKKSIVICEEFKHKEKYNLKAGQIFMSCDELAKYTGVSPKTVSSWINEKKWVFELI